MSLDAMAIVWAHSQAPTQAALLVMLAIADHEGDGGAWPAVETLARRARIKRDSARQIVRKLEELGEIRTKINEGGGLRVQKHMRTNVYEVLLECPWYCDRSRQHRDLRDAKNEQLRPAHWDALVGQYELGETPPVVAGVPCGGRGTPPVVAGANHPLTTQPMETYSSTVTYQHADAREDAAGADGIEASYADWNPGQKIAQAAKQVRASSKVKRPDLSKPLSPIGKVPPAPEYPRFEPDPPRTPPEPRTPEQEAAVQHASQLVCPGGFGDRPTTRHHWFPGTLTGCARCGTEAAELTRPALTELEHTS